MLLYPERGLVLNATGADIVQLCTGEHTVGGIVEQLAGKYAREPADVAQEVQTFLARLAERGLIRSGDE
jgi:pyrroloquinoline quinone biosynthesis protein D